MGPEFSRYSANRCRLTHLLVILHVDIFVVVLLVLIDVVIIVLFVVVVSRSSGYVAIAGGGGGGAADGRGEAAPNSGSSGGVFATKRKLRASPSLYFVILSLLTREKMM